MAMTTTSGAGGMALGQSGGRKLPWLAILLVILAAALPWTAGKTGLISNFYFLQISLMIVYAIAVLGLNLLTGFNGQISLGHGAFFAAGAYAAAILIDQSNWPYWATLPVAALVCFVLGYLFGCRPCGSKGTTSRWRRSRWRSRCRRSSNTSISRASRTACRAST